MSSFAKRPPLVRHPSGMTLPEFLLVLCLLSILALLAIPVTQKIRRQGQTVGCFTNMRSVGQTILTYAAENNNDLVPTLASDLPWTAWLDESNYLTKPSWNGREKSIMRCPARTSPPAIINGSNSLHYAMTYNPGFTNNFPVRKPVLRKLTAIANPGRTFLLGETEGWYSLSQIASNAAYPHNKGMNLFFADGHIEFYSADLSKTTSSNPFPFY